MKYHLTLLILAFLLTACYDDDDGYTPRLLENICPTCEIELREGDQFRFNDTAKATVLNIQDDFWCRCCVVCDCFSTVVVTLQIGNDILIIPEPSQSLAEFRYESEYEGSTFRITADDLGTCEDRRATDDYRVTLRIE